MQANLKQTFLVAKAWFTLRFLDQAMFGWMQSLLMSRLSRAIVGSAVAGRSKGSVLGKLYLIGIVLFVIISLFFDK